MPSVAQTYNDQRLDLLSREVFYRAMEQAKSILSDNETTKHERLLALAAVADAAACGFDTDREKEDEYD